MPPFLLPFLAGAKSFLGALLAFFAKPPGSYIAIALAVIAALWWYGQHEFNKGAASVVQKQQVQAVRLVEHQANITFTIAMNFEAVKLADAAKTAQIIQEIPAHVTPQIVLDYPLPCAFGRMFNTAWDGPVPDAAACPDGAASDTDLVTVTKVEAENAGKYASIAHQLMALQDWIRQQEGASLSCQAAP